MSALLERIGLLGLAALAIVAAAAGFHVGVQEPLEEELRQLQAAVRKSREPAPVVRVAAPESQMQAFYGFFEQPVAAHEWLAKLHTIGRASGVQLPAASYLLLPTRTRLNRYQVTLPLKATYAEARAFMANALNEMPVLSVDHASFRRIASDDPRLEVEIVVTLHLLEL